MLKLSLLVALAISLSPPAHACRLDMSLDASSGRIAGLAAAVPHAATEVVALPAGWTLSITNEPRWATSVSARAIVGAAFLSGTDVLSMLSFRPEPGFSCEALGRSPSVAVTLTFYRSDRLVRSRFGRGQLTFVP